MNVPFSPAGSSPASSMNPTKYAAAVSSPALGVSLPAKSSLARNVICRRISSGRIVAAARTVALSYSLPLDTGEGGAPGPPEPLEQALMPAVDKIRTLNLTRNLR